MKTTTTSRLSGFIAWTLLAAILSAPIAAAAGVFTVTPVRIYMTVRDRAVAVTITNDGDTSLVLQADLHTWTQSSDGEDQLQLTDDMILAPPIIKLAPKQRQVVRLARLAPPDPTRQVTYRFILREIPEASGSGGNVQVPIALALSMPVFITPPKAQRKVDCRIVGVNSGSIGLRCGNTGNAYAQIREIEIARGEQSLARTSTGAYILPGAEKTIAVKAESTVTPGPARAQVTFDDGKSQEFQLSLP